RRSSLSPIGGEGRGEGAHVGALADTHLTLPALRVGPLPLPAEERRGDNSAPADIREAIREQALAIGFDAVGFAPAHLAQEARDGLREFIERGYHGDMGWLAEHSARRGDPQTLWPETKTVVVLGVNYGP